MNQDNKTDQLSEQEVDQIVVSQVDDDLAWEEPIQVHRSSFTALSIPADLAARAAFLAQLHRTDSLDAWIVRVIQDRVELEEAAFTEAKQALATMAG